jgi:hypothetical protein
MQSCFINQPAIDANAIPAAQIANQDAVVSHGHAAMPSGNLLWIDADVTVEMSTDQQDRSMQGDLRRGSRDQGDESEWHSAAFSEAWFGTTGTGSSLFELASPAILTMTW